MLIRFESWFNSERARTFSCTTLVLALCASTSCEAGRAPSRLPPVVTITAAASRFEAPDSVPGGLTTLRLVTRGEGIHQVALFRLTSGKTLADLRASLARPGAAPAWVQPAGGVEPPQPGGTAEVTLELRPGTYALLCFIEGPDGAPQLVKGMMRELHVSAEGGLGAAPPDVTDTLTATEFAFTNSRPLGAGRHTFLFTNAGTQPHEVVFARLSRGRAAREMADWYLRPRGDPPAELLGGVVAISAGERAYVTVELTPGEYALFCDWPDLTDGRPHAAHGMVRQVTIR